jgi:hypothetical protein
MKPIVVAPSIQADAIVAGSAIFGSGDYAAAIARIRNGTSGKVVAQ